MTGPSDGDAAARRPRGRPSTERSAAITATILDQATVLFLAEGYEGVSIDAVAVAAGVPRTTVYKRFSDKNELLRAMVAHQHAAWSAASTAREALVGGAPETLLRYYCRVMLTAAIRQEVRAIRRLSRLLGGPDEPPAAGWPDHHTMLQVVTDAIGRIAAARKVTPKAPQQVALMLMAMIAGWAEGCVGPDGLTDAKVESVTDAMVDLAICGVTSW